MAALTQQDKLKAFLKRRHPLYSRMIAHWEFLQATYDGGRAWFDSHIFRGPKEGSDEFGERVKRAYRFNHTREAVDLVTKYLFKADITRQEDGAPSHVLDFWKKATRSGLDIQQYVKLLTSASSVFGQVVVFVDSKLDRDVQTVADEKAAAQQIYTYFFKPQDILDFALDEDDGDLLWIKVREYKREDYDPIEDDGEVKERFRLWTRTDWTLFEEIDAGQRGRIVRRIESRLHDLKRVPCFFLRHMLGESRYAAPGLIDDIAYLDRAVANYLSNLDVIIQDQTFSQLVMPAQGLMPGSDKYDALVVAGTKRIFTYDAGQTNTPPMYISPDAAQAGVILSVVNKIINEIYHTIGLAGERTKQDNAVGIDNSSGVAKAYDFERVNSLLNAKGESLENAENELVKLVCLYSGAEPPAEKLVEYPETYDTTGLLDEIAVAESLATIDGPKELRREHMMKVVEKLFPRLSDDLRTRLKNDIEKEWLKEEPLVLAPPTRNPAAPGPAGTKTVNPKPRQGQVTSATGTKG